MISVDTYEVLCEPAKKAKSTKDASQRILRQHTQTNQTTVYTRR